MLKKATFVTVRLTVLGVHCWPEAPSEESLSSPAPEVSALRHPHNHQFTFEVTAEVTHADRDIEFFLLRRAIWEGLQLLYLDKAVQARGFNSQTFDFGTSSCEHIATRLLEHLTCVYPKVPYWKVQVWEDQHAAGAVVAWKGEKE